MRPIASPAWLRAATTAHAVVVLGQIVIMVAVYMELLGHGTLHRHNAWLALALGLACAWAGLTARWSHNQGLMRAIALATPFLEASQIALGPIHGLVPHVAIGLLIWAMSAMLMFGAWSRPMPQPAK